MRHAYLAVGTIARFAGISGALAIAAAHAAEPAPADLVLRGGIIVTVDDARPRSPKPSPRATGASSPSGPTPASNRWSAPGPVSSSWAAA